MIASLLDEVIDLADLDFQPSGRPFDVAESHECDGCGEARPDVDLWATDSETGEELWLCRACGEW